MSACCAHGWSPGPALLHRNNRHRQEFEHSLTLSCKIQNFGEPLFFPRPSAASPPAQQGQSSPRPAAGHGLCWAAQGSGVNGVRRVLHPGHGPRAVSSCHRAREELGGCHLCWHCPVLVLVLLPQTLPMACPPREERRTGAYLAGNFNQISDLEPVFCFTNAIKESNCINQNHIILPIIKFPLTPLFTLPLLIN